MAHREFREPVPWWTSHQEKNPFRTEVPYGFSSAMYYWREGRDFAAAVRLAEALQGELPTLNLTVLVAEDLLRKGA